MANTPFFEREGKPYCKNDFEKLFAAKCEGCSKPIIDNTVIALNAKWHKDCFRCRVTNCFVIAFTKNVFFIIYQFHYKFKSRRLL